MPFTARHLALVIGLGVGFASPLSAQPALAHLSQVEGTVTRLHRFAPGVARVGVVLVAGDQLITAVGRAELTFVDGSVMHLDQHTQVAITAAARIRLIDGRISLRTTTAYTADTTTGIVHILSPSARSISSELRRDLAGAASGGEGGPEGVFELTANATNRDVLVHVVEGDARIESSWGSESVRSTQTAFVSGLTGQPFVSRSIQMQHDSFVQWCNSRYVAIMSASAGFATGQLRRDLAVATFGREGGPPPTFLPYAHPTYRQFAYERSRTFRFDRKRPEVTIRGEQVVRGERRRDTSASARETSGELRRDRAGATSGREGGPVRRAGSPKRADRDDRPRTQPPAVARPVRGSGKGAAVRQP